MEPDVGIWDRLTKAVLFLLLVALVVLLMQLYVPLFKQNQRYRERNLELEAEIQKEQQLAASMEKEIIALQTDQEAIERRSREQLGYGKEGEAIFRFETPRTNRPAGR